MIDFSTVVARAIILTLPLSGFIRSLQPHRLAVESAQHLQQFLLRADVQDDRIVAPDVLHGDGLEALVGPHVLPQQQPQQQGQGFGSPPISEFVARFVNVSAGFDETNMLLRDINLSILRRKVTMLYGRIGSGKSTFLRMLVGRMRPNNGSLLVATKSIGYCGQTPWISNASIRDNIIGKNAYNRLWLTFVIYICALNIDLRRFADGDLTMAGSGGCNLSGGQRSRIVSLYFTAAADFSGLLTVFRPSPVHSMPKRRSLLRMIFFRPSIWKHPPWFGSVFLVQRLF